MMLFAIPAFAMKNDPGGKFRGIPWGAKMPEKTILGGYEWAMIKIVGSNGPVITFHRLEKASFAGLTFSNPIEYEFHNRYGFIAARIKNVGRESYDLLVKACVKEWGPPDLDDIFTEIEEDYDFEGKLWVGEKVFVILEYYKTESQRYSLMFYEKQYHVKQMMEFWQQ